MGFIRFALVLIVVAISARLFMNYFHDGAYVVSLIDFSYKIDFNPGDHTFGKLKEEVKQSSGKVLQIFKVRVKTKDSHSSDTFNLTTQDWDIVMLTWYEDEKKAKTISKEGLDYYKNTERPISRWYSVPFDCKSNTFLVLLNIGLDIKGFFDNLRGVRPFEQTDTPHFVSLKDNDFKKTECLYVLNLMTLRDKYTFENLYGFPLLWSMAPSLGIRPSYIGTSLESHWEEIALVRYASFASIKEMAHAKIYSDLYVYRKKGIKEGMIIVCSPLK